MSRRAALTALASGAILAGAFPEVDAAPLAWVAIAPLLALARGRTPRAGAAIGAAFGVGFFGVLIIWIKYIGWIPWALLVVMQSAFIAAFGAGWALISRRWSRGALPALGAALLWVALEWLRSAIPIFGFTWGQLAQSQGEIPWLLRASGLAGGWGVAFALVAINELLARAWQRRSLLAGGAAAAVLLATVAAGAVFVRPTVGEERLRVAIVQGNVDRRGINSFEGEFARVKRHADLTTGLAGENLDLVVWPESSVGLDPEQEPFVAELIAGAARAADAPLVIGATLDVDPDHYLVVTLLVSPEGEIVDRYQKTHLVPFGEFVPARAALDWIPLLDQVPRDAIAGHDPRNFTAGGTQIATVISFEGDFGSLVRDRIALGARILVVATNTSTWATSWASAQHVGMSRLRAAETGVPVVHAALSGISAFVTPDGGVEEPTELYQATVVTADVTPAATVTPYVAMGDWLPWGSVVASIVLLMLARRPVSVTEL